MRYTDRIRRSQSRPINTVIEDEPDRSDSLIEDINIFNPIDYRKRDNCKQVRHWIKARNMIEW